MVKILPSIAGAADVIPDKGTPHMLASVAKN